MTVYWCYSEIDKTAKWTKNVHQTIQRRTNEVLSWIKTIVQQYQRQITMKNNRVSKILPDSADQTSKQDYYNKYNLQAY